MSYLKFLLLLFTSFMVNVWGILRQPYITYRRIIKQDPYQLVIIFILIGGYFFGISPIKTHTLHPFLLSLNTARLFTGALSIYIFICLWLYFLGKAIGREPKLGEIMLGWGYTLIPTLIWFLVTSIFYVLLPPPRSTSFWGTSFSVLFLVFSLSLLVWKGLLYYLTLRFSLKATLNEMFLISVVFFPTIGLISYLVFYLGIFKVPFI